MGWYTHTERERERRRRRHRMQSRGRMSSPWRAEEKGLFSAKQRSSTSFDFSTLITWRRRKNKSNPILSLSPVICMYFLCLSVSLKEEKTFSLIFPCTPHPPADVHSVSCIRESSLLRPVCASLSIKFSSRYTFSHFEGWLCVYYNSSSPGSPGSSSKDSRREFTDESQPCSGEVCRWCFEMTTSFDVSSDKKRERNIPPKLSTCCVVWTAKLYPTFERSKDSPIRIPDGLL